MGVADTDRVGDGEGDRDNDSDQDGDGDADSDVVGVQLGEALGNTTSPVGITMTGSALVKPSPS